MKTTEQFLNVWYTQSDILVPCSKLFLTKDDAEAYAYERRRYGYRWVLVGGEVIPA